MNKLELYAKIVDNGGICSYLWCEECSYQQDSGKCLLHSELYDGFVLSDYHYPTDITAEIKRDYCLRLIREHKLERILNV